MRLNKEKMDGINRNYDEKRHKKRVGHVAGQMGLEIKDSIDTTIFANGWQICKLEELGALIDELIDMKKAVEEETGLIF